MTGTSPRRRLLPLLGGHSGRSAMTCQYRCGNACDHPAPNTSGNAYFGDLLAKAVSRRGVFKAGAAGALVVGAVAGAGTALAGVTGKPPAAHDGDGALTFRPVPPNTEDAVRVPKGYKQALVVEWGDPILPGAPEFDLDNQTEAAQLAQFGYNCDFLAVLPLNDSFTRALLVSNHEYTNEELMFRGYTGPDGMNVEQVKVAMAAHGLSVVELVRVESSGKWRQRRDRLRYNRRIHTQTPFAFTGPAAGSDLLKTAADPAGTTPLGTLNNCAGGLTPWGTILSGEENFNQYYVGGDAAPEALKPSLKRYGIDITKRYPSGSRKWERADERFDLAKHPHEAHRQGWIIELDPFSPESTPKKHTALGRFKHEGANVIVAGNGRAVAYMGDDERFDYMYKFVSSGTFKNGGTPADREHNKTLLETGTLYVAKFAFTSAGEIDGSGKLPSDGAFNGTGQWIPLVRDGVSLVDGMTTEQVLVFTRLAGDKVGATKMDRPEDVQPNPKTGKVYAALTNNSRRGTSGQPAADEVNPRNANKHGHILEITEDGGDNTAETFTWTLPIICGDPADPATYFMGFDKSQVSPISCPDNVAFDTYGNLWLATDGAQLGYHDGLFAVPLEGPHKGHLKQFLSVPIGAETCGPFITEDNRSVFVAVQHPGEVDGATVENPASVWPHGEYAKPGVVCTYRSDGGEIGK